VNTIYYPCNGSGCISYGEYFTYDTNGNLSEHRTAINTYHQYTYDLNRNLETKRVEGLNSSKQPTPATRTTSTEWHPTLRLPTQIAEPLKITTITYDAAGRVLTRTVQATTDADGSQGFNATLTGAPRTWTNTYDGNGQLIHAQSPDGTSTAYTYYPVNATCAGGHYGCRGQMQTITDPQGLTTTFNAYDALGRLIQSTDPYGVVTTQTYNWRGRLLTRTIGTLTTAYTYDTSGKLIDTTQPDGAKLYYDYDAAGRLIRLRDNEGNSIDTTLDLMSNKTAEIIRDPQGNLRRAQYWEVDAFGALKRQINAHNAATAYTYDLAGNLTAETDPLNRKTQYQYDTLNRVTQSTDAMNGVTKYTYDRQSRITGVTDPRGLNTGYTYNGFGELLTQTSPDTGVTSYTYDPVGRLTGKTDAKGNVTSYGYDSQSRLISTTVSSQTTGYAYDAQGRLSAITEPSGTTGYTYDALGRIVQKRQTQGARIWNVHYAYNAVGQLGSVTYPSGTNVEYGYTQGKLSSVKVNGQMLLNNITHEPFGPINGWTWSNGAVYKNTYDLNGRITQTTLPNLPAAHHYFDYDNLNRLTRAETINGDLTRYTYDATGNRTAKTVNGEQNTYINDRQSNRLIRVEGSTNLVTESYEYDEVGSTVSRLSASGSDAFVYDARGRMIQANGTLYKINALEQRIEKQGAGANTPSGTRQFVYDEMGHLIGEYDPISGAAQIEHVWLGDIPVAAIKGGQIYYVYPDHLGTPRAITNTANQTVWYWNYNEPFGKTEANENPSGAGVFTYNLRFPGQYFDSETGLHQNWHRDYNPEIGKYAQSDPIGLEGGLNGYTYTTGNPLIYIDPEGKQHFGGITPPYSFPNPCNGPLAAFDCRRHNPVEPCCDEKELLKCSDLFLGASCAIGALTRHPAAIVECVGECFLYYDCKIKACPYMLRSECRKKKGLKWP
jgi:RHS repeat-associated protein